MNSKPVLDLADVHRILDAATKEARQNGWAVSIAVADDGGHALGMLRMDGASPLTAYIAGEKAGSAALGRRETKFFEDIINAGRASFLSTPLKSALEGGVPIVIDGHTVGAVGVSGVKSDQDAQIARAGIAAIAN